MILWRFNDNNDKTSGLKLQLYEYGDVHVMYNYKEEIRLLLMPTNYNLCL